MAGKGNLGLLVAVTSLVLVAAFLTAVSPWPHEPFSTHMFSFFDGSLHVNDAGRSHGGFEYAAEYDVSFSSYRWVGQNASSGPAYEYLSGDTVSLAFSLASGLGDALQVHTLSLEVSYDSSAEAIVLEGGGVRIVAELVEDDTVWGGAWDGYYIAAWGGDAPAEELRGEISPVVFGLPEHFYVELRLGAIVSFITE